MSTGPQIPPAEALVLQSLISPAEQGIASRILAKTGGGNLTLFAFDAGQGLTEHTSPFDALVMVLDGVTGELQIRERFLGFRDLARTVRCVIWPSYFCICWRPSPDWPVLAARVP